MTNIIKSRDGQFDIVIPACTREWANITVAYRSKLKYAHGNGSVQKKIDLKTFDLAEGELETGNSSQMRFQDYYEVVLSHETEILMVCAVLNDV